MLRGTVSVFYDSAGGVRARLREWELSPAGELRVRGAIPASATHCDLLFAAGGPFGYTGVPLRWVGGRAAAVLSASA